MLGGEQDRLVGAIEAGRTIPQALKEVAPRQWKRHDLLKQYDEARAIRREWIRKMVLEQDRVDILATEVLGYKIYKHHLGMLRNQHLFPDKDMCLGFRGGGKTTCRTVVDLIYRLLKNPNSRHIVASKSAANASKILTEIRGRFTCEDFTEVFGNWRGDKWDEYMFDVRPKTSGSKETSVTALGVESAVSMHHVERIYCDDLVDEEYARTHTMREKMRSYVDKTLGPCLMPRTGSMTVQGTPYHHQDQYSRWQEGEFKGRTHLCPALRGNEDDGWSSAWPEEFPVEWLLKKREIIGMVFFDLQYQMNVATSRGGGIIRIDDCPIVDRSAVPPGLPCYVGVDLAASLDPKADRFAMVAAEYDKQRDMIYVVDHVAGRYPIRKQKPLLYEFADRHKMVRGMVEKNGYQATFEGEVKAERKDLNLIGIIPGYKPEQLAVRMAARSERGGLAFVRGTEAVLSEVIQVPDGEHDDLFSGLHLAIAAATGKARKIREEFGLI